MNCLQIEIAVMKMFGVRQNLIVPNVSWGITPGLHECDLLILSKSNYATEVEIKTTKHDLLKDKEKPHGHSHPYIARLFFAVPEKLEECARGNIPGRAGLIVVREKTGIVDGNKFFKAEKFWAAGRRRNCHQWTEDERNNLARLGCMRILGLKEKLSTK